MNNEFWNQRYSKVEYAYGIEPNSFFKNSIIRLNPGKLLVPAAGEGRDAVYAATLGWDVLAFDPSEYGRKKALELAVHKGVYIDYKVCDAEVFHADPASFDAIVLSYFHLPSSERRATFKKLTNYLRPGGKIMIEAFNKGQQSFNSGGPKDIDQLISKGDLINDFSELKIEYLEELNVVLDEGPFHQGEAAVIRCIAVRP